MGEDADPDRRGVYPEIGMKLFGLAFLMLAEITTCSGQTTSGGLAFPGSSGTTAETHFGIDVHGFPDTSSRQVDRNHPVHPGVPAQPIPYAYPVPPLTVVRGNMAGVGFGEAAASGHLILVFRDQTVEASSACWIDGQWVHYVTLFNSSRKIPVKRVNWKLTEETNSIRRGSLIFILKARASTLAHDHGTE